MYFVLSSSPSPRLQSTGKNKRKGVSHLPSSACSVPQTVLEQRRFICQMSATEQKDGRMCAKQSQRGTAGDAALWASTMKHHVTVYVYTSIFFLFSMREERAGPKLRGTF